MLVEQAIIQNHSVKPNHCKSFWLKVMVFLAVISCSVVCFVIFWELSYQHRQLCWCLLLH